MLRRIALSLSLLVSIVVMLPLVNSAAHNLRSQFVSSQRFHHHSRAWWRRHRALMRRRQALLARKRAMLSASYNGATSSALPKLSDNHSVSPALALPADNYRGSDATMTLPNGWSAGSNINGVENFRIAPPNGIPETQATLAVVALATANANQAVGHDQRNALSGVSFSDLRRNVIDKMISAGGWVVNDRQREIGGHRVFEVIAQTPASRDGKSEQVWNFYFTEINGRIYSLTTHAGGGFTEKLASDAERFLSAFSPLEAKRRAVK